MGSFFYDDYYDYGDLDLGVGGLFGGLLGGFGSLFDGLFSYDYNDDYDYYGYYDSFGYGYDDDEYDFTGDDDTSLTVDSYDSLSGLGDLGILGSIFGLFDDSSLSVDGTSGLLGLLESISYLFSYDYDDYGYGDYDYSDYDDTALSIDGELCDVSGLLSSILGMLGDGDTGLSIDGSDADVSGLLSSILGMLGDGDTGLSIDGSDADLSGLLTSILGMLGDGDTTLTVDGDLGDVDGLLSSIFGLLGDSGTVLTVDGESADIGGFLSSILGMFGGDETALTVDGGDADLSGFLSSFLGLLDDSGTALTVDGESADIGGFLSSILGMFDGDESGLSLTVDSELGDLGGFLSSFLTLFGGSDTALTVDAESADLSGILSSILGGSSGLDLSSILGLLGGSGTTLSVDSESADLSGILSSILGGSSGLALSSLLGLLGGSDTTLSVGSENSASSGLDLSSILALLGGSGTSTAISGATASTGIDLSSILALLGGSGSSLNISGSTNGLSNIGNLFSGLASLYNGIANMDNTTGEASWEDLAFLDDLENILPNSNNGTSLDLSSILALLGGSGTSTAVSGTTAASSSLDLASILALLGGSGTTITVDNTSTTTTPTVSATPSNSTQTSDLKVLLDALADNNAKLKLDITLTTDDGSTASIQFDGLLSTFLNNMPATLTIDNSFEDLIAPYYTTTVSVLPTEESDETAKSLPTTVSWESNQDTAADDPRSAILERSQVGGYWVEIAADGAFDGAVRIFTTDTAFDVDGSAGAFAVRASAKGGDFSDASAEWTSETAEPRRIVSNGNGVADVFFATAAEGDVWTANYFAQNAITGETADIAGKNRIRDTFTGSESDANILYLTDASNGDALFMDDVYSEFGDAARLSLIREVRSGAGDDVVDMTGEHYTAKLAGMTVRGGSGNDVLWGADGGNWLFGDDGADKITGGSGDDVIAGGDGNDTLNGGGGNDVFTFGNDWGADVVTQLAGGSVTLWFADAESMIRVAELAGNTLFTNATGSSIVMVQGLGLADITVKYGDDGSDEFAALNAAGAFLGSTADSVFETQEMRSQGILASL